MTGTDAHSRARNIFLIMGIVLLGAVFMLVFASSGHAESWKIRVKSAVCVQGPIVLLGEIAEPVGDVSASQWQKLSTMKLWKASDRTGRVVAVSRAKLREIFQHYMGDLADRLVLPSQISVQTGGKVLDQTALERKAVEFIRLQAGVLEGEVEIKDLIVPDALFLRDSADKVVLSMSGKLRPGRIQFRISGETPDGKVIRSSTGTAFLNVWRAVPSAAMPLNRGEVLTPDKITFVRRNLAYNPNLWDGTGGPWRMARSLGRGQPFTTSHVEPVPLVDKGERVTLVFKGPRVQLTMKAEALGQAGLGQQVDVMNPNSKRIVQATVVGRGLVMVR